MIDDVNQKWHFEIINLFNENSINGIKDVNTLIS
jgi:hypothetical protein